MKGPRVTARYVAGQHPLPPAPVPAARSVAEARARAGLGPAPIEPVPSLVDTAAELVALTWGRWVA